MAIHTLSICTGGGGLELGLELACPDLFKPVAYVECEAYAASILAARMDEKALPKASIWSDVRTLCDAGFSDYVRERTGGQGIGMLCGGYPCQDYSIAGLKEGMEGSCGKLWFDIVKALEKYKPKLCFFENVANHLIIGFDTVFSDLRALGYSVAAGLFTAAEVGFEFAGKRLFIFASANSLYLGGILGASTEWGTQRPAGSLDSTSLFTCRRQRYFKAAIKAPFMRKADGLAQEMEQLRLLGNGVVPLQAAYAFTTLVANLFQEEKE